MISIVIVIILILILIILGIILIHHINKPNPLLLTSLGSNPGLYGLSSNKIIQSYLLNIYPTSDRVKNMNTIEALKFYESLNIFFRIPIGDNKTGIYSDKIKPHYGLFMFPDTLVNADKAGTEYGQYGFDDTHNTEANPDKGGVGSNKNYIEISTYGWMTFPYGAYYNWAPGTGLYLKVGGKTMVGFGKVNALWKLTKDDINARKTLDSLALGLKNDHDFKVRIAGMKRTEFEQKWTNDKKTLPFTPSPKDVTPVFLQCITESERNNLVADNLETLYNNIVTLFYKDHDSLDAVPTTARYAYMRSEASTTFDKMCYEVGKKKGYNVIQLPRCPNGDGSVSFEIIDTRWPLVDISTAGGASVTARAQYYNIKKVYEYMCNNGILQIRDPFDLENDDKAVNLSMQYPEMKSDYCCYNHRSSRSPRLPLNIIEPYSRSSWNPISFAADANIKPTGPPPQCTNSCNIFKVSGIPDEFKLDCKLDGCNPGITVKDWKTQTQLCPSGMILQDNPNPTSCNTIDFGINSFYNGGYSVHDVEYNKNLLNKTLLNIEEPIATYQFAETLPKKLHILQSDGKTAWYDCFDDDFINEIPNIIDTYKGWSYLVNSAKHTIEFACSNIIFYEEVKFIPDPTNLDKDGKPVTINIPAVPFKYMVGMEEFVGSLENAVRRGIKIIWNVDLVKDPMPQINAVAMAAFGDDWKNKVGDKYLVYGMTITASCTSADNFQIWHHKHVIVDEIHLYIGSNNAYAPDSKELGIIIENAPSIAKSLIRYLNVAKYYGIISKYNDECFKQNGRSIPTVFSYEQENRIMNSANADMIQKCKSKNFFTYVDFPKADDIPKWKEIESEYNLEILDKNNMIEGNFYKPYNLKMVEKNTNNTPKYGQIFIAIAPPFMTVNGRSPLTTAVKNVFTNVKSAYISAMCLTAENQFSGPDVNGKANFDLFTPLSNSVIYNNADVKLLPAEFYGTNGLVNPKKKEDKQYLVIGDGGKFQNFKADVVMPKISIGLNSSSPGVTHIAATTNEVAKEYNSTGKMDVRGFRFGNDLIGNNPPIDTDEYKYVWPGYGLTHSKYAVTDKWACISTANFGYDNLLSWGNSMLFCKQVDVVSKLQAVFNRDWNSKYANKKLSPDEFTNYTGVDICNCTDAQIKSPLSDGFYPAPKNLGSTNAKDNNLLPLCYTIDGKKCGFSSK